MAVGFVHQGYIRRVDSFSEQVGSAQMHERVRLSERPSRNFAGAPEH